LKEKAQTIDTALVFKTKRGPFKGPLFVDKPVGRQCSRFFSGLAKGELQFDAAHLNCVVIFELHAFLHSLAIYLGLGEPAHIA
jgi:hypothetical protein